MPDPSKRVRLSPLHEVELTETFAYYIDHTPEDDVVITSLAKKMAGGEPLIQGELVIAGHETREKYPLAWEYPVHFRKTYYPTCFHQNPKGELDNLNRAAEILGIPAAIGCTRTTFRSCFVPGRPFNRLSPFGVEPPERNIEIAQEQPAALLIGMWKLLEELFADVKLLHAGGLVHGDLYLHNAIISLSPVQVCLIDFELAKSKTGDNAAPDWDKAVAFDRQMLLTEAVFVQCGLGRQFTPLGDAAEEALEELFGRHAGRYRRAMAKAGAARAIPGSIVYPRAPEAAA
ncbi:MAG: phosphotransferase [Verrucomicrobiota bacterium]